MTAETPAPREYVIRKGGYFYRSAAAGYTAAICAAGRYTKEDAEKHQDPETGVTVHHISEFPPVLDAYAALQRAVEIAEEAREEWDKAPSGMRAGKILIALSGGCPGYRKDIDEIHDVLRRGNTAS